MFITQHYDVSGPLAFKDKQFKMEQTGYKFMKTHRKSNKQARLGVKKRRERER